MAFRKNRMFDQLKELREQRLLESFVEDVILDNKDFWLWHVPEPVEWDIEAQCWAVAVSSHGDIVFEPGEKIVMLSGRGGAREYASVENSLSLETGEGRYYYLNFDSVVEEGS